VAAEAFKKLSPRVQIKNPVMFVVFLGSIVTTLLFIQAVTGKGEASAPFIFAIAAWLWFTVLFANAAEAMAEGRGKAQADALRATRQRVLARMLKEPRRDAESWPQASDELGVGAYVLVEAGEIIPADGEVLQGAASVDESAITGESAPVIREAGGDFASVTGGTRVLSDWIVVEVTAKPGEAFLDRMIAMVEGAKRGKTPNEIALTILLVALTIIFLLVCVTLLPFSSFSTIINGSGTVVTITVLIALLVCLIPTTIGALLSAVGIAGMSRMMKANVLATSGRAIEAAGDVDVLLLDKTGTITLGNREATKFHPRPASRARAGRRGAARIPCRRDARRALYRDPGQKRFRHPRPRASGRGDNRFHRANPNERHQHRRPPDPERCGQCDPRPCRGDGRCLPRGSDHDRRRSFSPRQHTARR
jgi:K+-transporting ATPase ATPase B chain